MRNGGEVLVDQLAGHGVDTVFTVPGESFLNVIDAIYDKRETIDLVTTRHEAGASNMADAYAKLTGKPGICLVNRGPGAAHASVGVHTAYQDSTPMIVLIGQGPIEFLGRESFQEVDHRIFYSELTKWSAQIDKAERIPEMVRKAFQVARQGRPGPVALALPEDVLGAEIEVNDLAAQPVAVPHPDPDQVEATMAMLAEAERPVVIVGGGGWSEETAAHVRRFVEANQIPTVASFRCQDYLDNDSPSYIGYAGLAVHPVVADAISGADLLIVIGARLGEATTNGYQLIEVAHQKQRIVHVHRSAEELGSVFRADLPVNSDYERFARALAEFEPVDSTRWRDWCRNAREAYIANLEPAPAPGELNLASVVRHVSDTMPDAIITNGAGNFTVWAHRYHQFHRYRTQLGPTSGAMGYGVPAAVAAKVVRPQEEVICWTGDGDALMCIQELAVAIQRGLDPIVLLVNNGMLATMRMHQERRFPGRVLGTDLSNPDFTELARAFGAHAEKVVRTDEFPSALRRAREAGVASLIELMIDPEQLTPTATLTGTRRAAESSGQDAS